MRDKRKFAISLLLVVLMPAVAVGDEGANLFSRTVLIGASVSGGFTKSEMLGGPKTAGYRLKHYFDAAILGEHEPTEAFGGSFFFMSPEKNATASVEKALTKNPSLVVALDFMFWFCYGEGLTPEQRFELFEKGLALLEKIEVPLVVGDIPDASAAIDKMLSSGQVPPKEVIEKCNKRLSEWAKDQKKVSVIPLSDFMKTTIANKPLKVRTHLWPAGSTRALLQDDLLHPSHHGCVGLTVFALNAAIGHDPSLSDDCICWDLQKIYEEGLAASAPKPDPEKTAAPPPAAEVKVEAVVE